MKLTKRIICNFLSRTVLCVMAGSLVMNMYMQYRRDSREKKNLMALESIFTTPDTPDHKNIELVKTRYGSRNQQK